jgi:hypothetical protein
MALAKYGTTPEERYFTRWVDEGGGKPVERLYNYRGAQIATTRRVNGRLLPWLFMVLLALAMSCLSSAAGMPAASLANPEQVSRPESMESQAPTQQRAKGLIKSLSPAFRRVRYADHADGLRSADCGPHSGPYSSDARRGEIRVMRSAPSLTRSG